MPKKRRNYRGKRGEKDNRGSGGLPSSGLPFGSLLRPSEPRLNLSISSGELSSPTSSAVKIATVLCHPWDDNSSQMSMMTEWYKRMRAINSGATNYNTAVLYSYFSIVRAARAAWWNACKMIHALQANEPNFVNNAAFFYYLSGGQYYSQATAQLADWTNKLLTQAKQLEAIVIPDFETLKNDRIIYGYVLREAHKRRTSYATHVMPKVQYSQVVQSSGQWVPQNTEATLGNGNYYTPMDYMNFIDTCLALLSTTYVYSTLQGDMIKTYGMGAYHIDLISWYKEGLHIDDSIRINRITQNAGMFAVGDTNVSSVLTADGEVKSTITVGSLNYPFYNLNAYGFVVDDDTPEEFYYYSLLRPIIDGTSLITRGYVVVKAITMANGSTTSATTRFDVSSVLNDAQTSTVQSTAEAAHTNLANLATLWEYMPAYCPRGSGNTMVWHMDDVRIYSKTDMLNSIIQGIRKELDSKAFVAQSNAAKA